MTSENPQAQNSASGGNPPLIDHSRTSQYAPKCHQMLDRLTKISDLEKIIDPLSGTELAGEARTALTALFRTAAMTAAIRSHKEPSVVEDLKAFLDEYEADLERWASQDSQMAVTMAESTKVSVISYRDKLTEISNRIQDLAGVANVFTKALLWQKADLDKLKLEVEDYTPTRVLIPNDNLVEGTGEAEGVVLRNMTCEWLNGKEAMVKKMHSKNGPTFSSAKFAIWKMVLNDHSYVAAKAFNGHPEQQDIQRLQRLVGVWKGMDHPNVLPLLGVCRFDNDKKLYLISRWMKYGTVRDYITYHPEADRLQLIHDVALGLQHIHNRNLVHGKLRSENILVDLNQRARICGFSLSKKFTGRAQTIDWYAYTDDGRWNPTKQAIWTAKSDIWCWAMTAVEILSGDRPFPDIPSISVDDLQRIQKGTLRPAREDYRSSIPSDHLWGLLESCWSVEENERPDIGTVVQEVANERIGTGWDPLKWNPKPEPRKDWDWPESS